MPGPPKHVAAIIMLVAGSGAHGDGDHGDRASVGAREILIIMARIATGCAFENRGTATGPFVGSGPAGDSAIVGAFSQSPG